MKTKKMIIALFFAAATITGFAQTQSFDCEIIPWHKKAILTCGMIKDQNPDFAIISKNLNELQSELKAISDNYINKPPREYEKDPNWKSYLVSLNEYVAVIKERVENKQYTQASVFCPYFCMTIGKLHKINGKTDLTDVMFAWRTELKNTSDMFLAGNTAGANQNISIVEDLYQKVIAMKTKKNDGTLNELFTPLDDAYKTWLKAVKTLDIQAINLVQNKFIEAFSKPYLATL